MLVVVLAGPGQDREEALLAQELKGPRCGTPQADIRPARAATTPNCGCTTRCCAGSLASIATTTFWTSAAEPGRRPGRPRARLRQAARLAPTSPRPPSSAPASSPGPRGCATSPSSTPTTASGSTPAPGSSPPAAAETEHDRAQPGDHPETVALALRPRPDVRAALTAGRGWPGPPLPCQLPACRAGGPERDPGRPGPGEALQPALDRQGEPAIGCVTVGEKCVIEPFRPRQAIVHKKYAIGYRTVEHSAAGTGQAGGGSGQAQDAGRVLVEHLGEHVVRQAQARQLVQTPLRGQEGEVAAPHELAGQPPAELADQLGRDP